MAEPRDYRQADIFRPALEAIIDMGHPLVRLAGKIDWGFLDRRLGEVYAAGDGQPPLPVRLIAGLFIKDLIGVGEADLETLDGCADVASPRPAVAACAIQRS